MTSFSRLTAAVILRVHLLFVVVIGFEVGVMFGEGREIGGCIGVSCLVAVVFVVVVVVAVIVFDVLDVLFVCGFDVWCQCVVYSG